MTNADAAVLGSAVAGAPSARFSASPAGAATSVTAPALLTVIVVGVLAACRSSAIASCGDSAFTSRAACCAALMSAVTSAPAGEALKRAEGAPATADPKTAASAFVNRYGQGFGLRAGQQAVVTRVSALPGGATAVRLQQKAGGLPVVGGELIITVDRAGRVLVATGETPASLPTATTAAISAQAAGVTAIAAAASRLGLDEAQSAQLLVNESKLWLFDPAVVGAPGRAQLRPTWRVTVGWAGYASRAATVLVDAVDGAVALAYSEIHTAKHRTICDGRGSYVLSYTSAAIAAYECKAGGPNPVARVEGGAASGVAAVNKAYDLLGATYDFYKNSFGRDSIDGHGLPLRASVRMCDMFGCPMENASWIGDEMVFGAGFEAADDVVAHELTHGVTQHTSDLIYYSESGALNESMSDIFGELVDQSRIGDNDSAWLLGEDLPPPYNPVRSMSDPLDYGQPDHVPDGSGSYPQNDNFWDQGYFDYDDNYGVHWLSGVPNKAAYLIAHGGTLRGTTVTGIGNAKSAQIWYRAQHLLPAGAQFHTLATILPVACRSILGLAGIAAADCNQVDRAILATNLGTTAHDPFEVSMCPSAGQQPKVLFRDGFERGSARWTPSPNWFELPSAEIPVTFAHSGRGSFYSWLPEGGSPVQPTFAEMVGTVTIPAGTTYVWFATNTPTNHGGGDLAFRAEGQVSGQVLPTATPAPYDGFTLGYDSIRYDVSAFAGQTGSFSLRPNNALPEDGDPYADDAEWVVDDFTIYQCLPQAGPPRGVAAQLAPDKLTATVSWSAPLFAGTGITGYEVTVTPTPAGATMPIVVGAGVTEVPISGLDPAVRYVVGVRTLGAAGAVSSGVSAWMPTDPLFDCSSQPVGDGRRSACAGVPLPYGAPR